MPYALYSSQESLAEKICQGVHQPLIILALDLEKPSMPG